MRRGREERRKRTEIFLPNFMAVEKGKRSRRVEKSEPFMSSQGISIKKVHERVS